jgi:hypothetical protein
MLALAHELTHFINRILSRDLLAEPINSTNYVNLCLQKQLTLWTAVRPLRECVFFIEEIGCRHVAWRTLQDLVKAHAEKQIAGGVIVRPGALGDLGSSLFCVDILTKTNAVKLKNHLIHRE